MEMQAQMNIQVSASILSADFGHLADELKRTESSSCDRIHFDVMDGHFVPNISYGVPVLKSIRRYSRLPFEAHLMITDPISYIKPFADAGADMIIFHLEAGGDTKEIIDLIRSFGVRVGMSIKPKTPIELMYEWVKLIDMALIMTVEPGFGGQGLIPDTLGKVKSLRKYANKIDARLFDIEVDGGITDKTAPQVTAAGANVLVSGSYLFRAEDMAKNCRLLRARD